MVAWAMEEFDLTDETQYWVYATTPTLWTELKNHLERNEADSMYISSCQYYDPKHKHHSVKEGDVIFIYTKATAPKTGFVCVAQVASPMIDNEAAGSTITVYADQNLNRCCYRLVSVMMFDPIKLNSVIGDLPDVRSKQEFSGKYLKLTTVFNLFPHDSGDRLLANIISCCPEQVAFDEVSRDSVSDSGSVASGHGTGAGDGDMDGETATETEPAPEAEAPVVVNMEGMIIPMMIVLCQRALNSVVSQPDQEGEVIYEHLLNCRSCDVTDNGDSRARLLLSWSRATVEYSEVDSNHDEFKGSLIAYHGLTESAPTNVVPGTPLVKLLNIIEEGNLYNNCMLVQAYLPDAGAPTASDNDVVRTDSDADVVHADSDCDAGRPDSDADVVCADSDADVVCADSDADIVCADSETDVVCTGSDADVVGADSETDTVCADSETDAVCADSESDAVHTESESDAVHTESETDTVTKSETITRRPKKKILVPGRSRRKN